MLLAIILIAAIIIVKFTLLNGSHTTTKTAQQSAPPTTTINITNKFFIKLLDTSNSSDVFGISYRTTFRYAQQPTTSNLSNGTAIKFAFDRYGNASRLSIISGSRTFLFVKVADKYFECAENLTFSKCFILPINQSNLNSTLVTEKVQQAMADALSVNLSASSSEQEIYDGKICTFMSASGDFYGEQADIASCASNPSGIVYNFTSETNTSYISTVETDIANPVSYAAVVSLPNQTTESLYNVSIQPYYTVIYTLNQPFSIFPVLISLNAPG